jgi:hypothetical protein
VAGVIRAMTVENYQLCRQPAGPLISRPKPLLVLHHFRTRPAACTAAATALTDDSFDLGSLPIAEVLPSHNPEVVLSASSVNRWSLMQQPFRCGGYEERHCFTRRRGRGGSVLLRQASRRLPARCSRCSCGAGLVEKQPSAISGQIRRPNPLSVAWASTRCDMGSVKITATPEKFP